MAFGHNKVSYHRIILVDGHFVVYGLALKRLITEWIQSSQDSMANKTTPIEDEGTTRSSGGWGRWVILAGIFFASVLEVGSVRTLSLFLEELTFQFDTSTTYVGAIYGLATGMPYILGLVNIPLFRRFSVRHLVMLGGTLSSAGLIAASYSTTISGLTTAILAYGLGYTFIILPIDSCQIDYFPDKFEIATGINYAGASLGVMVLPWIFETFIDIYGWRGGMLLLGGMNAHVVAFGALMKPVKKGPKNKNKNSNSNTTYIESLKNSNFEKVSTDDHLEVEEGNVQVDPSMVALLEVVDCPKVNNSDKIVTTENGVVLSRGEHDSTEHISSSDKIQNSGIGTTASLRGTEIERRVETCGKKEHNVSSSNMSTKKHSSNTSNYDMRNGMSARRRSNWIYSFVRFFREHPVMIIVCMQVFLFALTYGTWLLFTIPNAVAKGLPGHRASQLSLAGGVANFFGRLAYGFVGSQNFAKMEVWYLIFNILSAIAFFVNYVADSFWFLMILSLLFGFAMGFKSPAQMSLVMNAVGLQHFKTGVGLNYLCAGTAFSVLGSISGAIYDRTQSYNISFCIMGALDLVGGILTILPVAWSKINSP